MPKTPLTEEPTLNPVTLTHEEKLKKILNTARKRVGLKPMHLEHISATPITDNINDPKYAEIRKNAATEFLDKELKISTSINIVSTKMSQGSPIMWIELDDIDKAEM